MQEDCIHILCLSFMLLEAETERSGERLPKAARGSIEARNAAVEQLLGPQIDLRDLVVAVA